MVQRENNQMRIKPPERKKRKKVNYYDYNLLAVLILLTCFGLIMIYSTSAYSAQLMFDDRTFFFNKQMQISAVCLIAVLIGSQINYRIYIKFTPYIYILTVILLILTRFVGKTVNGATRWIEITNSIQIQPAEVAKVAIIMFLPFVILKKGRKLKELKSSVTVLGLGLFLAYLTLEFTSNLSTAIIIAGITVVILYIAHPKTWPFILAFVVGIIGVLLFVSVAKQNLDFFKNSDNYQLNRIYAWLNLEGSSSAEGYQIIQGLYAVGSGGFFGKGLGNSSQKMGAVPEAQNDMIFSIICEELGVFGAFLIIVLFIYLLYRLLYIAQNAPDLYGSLMVTGIFAHIAIQVVLNIAVVLGVIPPTGITLPFISYGGTSVVFLMAEMTLALSVSKQIKYDS
jgi:Bacterial cell division membrane protein